MTGSPRLRPTPGQTVGPFFGFALDLPGGADVVPAGHEGALRLCGTVWDGAGAPVPDALIEIWQPGPDGRAPRVPGTLRRDGRFTGWGRCATDDGGGYRFVTLTPGASRQGPGPASPGTAAFFAVCVFARGLLDRLHTRAYLPDDAEALANDPLLQGITPQRRSTLIASRESDDSLRFDIRLQGEGETVFLQFPGA